MYDPNTETTNEEIVIAGHWELLRRNAEFRSLAVRWLKSAQFRRTYALTSDYHNLQQHTPRCALDWMLTTEQRVALAEFQIENQKWIFDSRFNFGSFICRENISPLEVTRKNFREHFHPELLPNPPMPLRVDQSWGEAPELFKKQFRIAYGSEFEFGEISPGLNSVAKFLRDAAVLLKRDPVKNSQVIAPLLFKFGSELRDLAEFCKVYSIPKRSHSEKQFRNFLVKIRDNFNASVPLIPTKTYDLHESYQGTTEDWRWFLEAERLGLDIRNSADLRTLSERYSEDLRDRAKRGKAPRRAKTHGFSGENIPSKAAKNRRSTVRRHVQAIEKWIHKTFPRQASEPGAASS